MENQETFAKKALRLLTQVPESEWITEEFSDGKACCCAIGHFTRLTSKNPADYSWQNCSDTSIRQEKLRRQSKKFLRKKNPNIIPGANIANVNNGDLRQYPQPTPKSRTVALLADMVEAGF